MKQIEFVPIEERTMNDKLVNLYGKHIVGLYTDIEKVCRDDQFPIKPACVVWRYPVFNMQPVPSIPPARATRISMHIPML